MLCCFWKRRTIHALAHIAHRTLWWFSWADFTLKQALFAQQLMLTFPVCLFIPFSPQFFLHLLLFCFSLFTLIYMLCPAMCTSCSSIFLLFIFTLIRNTHNITAGPVAVQLCLGACFWKVCSDYLFVCPSAISSAASLLPLLITRYFCVTLNYLFW